MGTIVMAAGKDVLKFHTSFMLEGEKVRLTAKLIAGDPQRLDIEAILLDSQTVYKGSMTEEMCDVLAMLHMLKTQQASLFMVEEGVVLLCSPAKILLTPTEEELDIKELRIEMLEESMSEASDLVNDLRLRMQVLEDKLRTTPVRVRPEASERTDSRSELLTNHVWPKSRMLLVIVSRLFKEGMLNHQQRGQLKELILEEDLSLLQCLQQYEADGDRRQLYSSFLKLATV